MSVIKREKDKKNSQNSFCQEVKRNYDIIFPLIITILYMI